jgi:hypothetical protein
MLRKLLLLAVFLPFAVVATADDTKPESKDKGKGIDKGKMFEKMDTNADGKLSKDEVTKGIEGIKERLNDKGGKAGQLAEKIDADKIFEKLDADKDGSISKDEFEKGELFGDRGAAKGKFKGKFKGKGDPETKPETEKPAGEKKPPVG